MSLSRSSAVVFVVGTLGACGACPSNWDGRLELLWDWSQDAMMPEMEQHRRYTQQLLAECKAMSWPSVQDLKEALNVDRNRIQSHCPEGIGALAAACWQFLEDQRSELLPLLVTSLELFFLLAADPQNLNSPIGIPEWNYNLELLAAGAQTWEKLSVPYFHLMEGDPSCWSGGFTFAFCCPNFGKGVNLECFDELYTFERCCFEVRRNIGKPVYLENIEHVLLLTQLSEAQREEVQRPVTLELGYQICEPTGQGCDHHCYTPIYQETLEKLLTKISPRVPKVLHLGVCLGESLVAWAKWLNGTVVGLDIHLGLWNRTKDLFRARDPNSLEKVMALELDSMTAADELRRRFGAESFDFILDDGDHNAAAVERSFKRLFLSLLKPGGVYMIEDCRYAQKQNGLELFRHLSGQLQVYNSAGSAALNYEVQTKMDPLEAWVESIAFHRSIVTITKRAGMMPKRVRRP